MPPEDTLLNFLRGRICLLGFGNRMWRDDGAGSLLAEALENSSTVDAVDGGMVPENHLESVARKKPDTILLVDAADFGGLPGEWRLLEPGDTALTGVSTHAGSPHMLASYLEARTGAPVGMLAIQPGTSREGEGLSEEVAASVEALRALLSVV